MGLANAEAGIVWKTTQKKGAVVWRNETISPLWSLLRVLMVIWGSWVPALNAKKKKKIGKQDRQSHRLDHIDALGQRKRIMNRRGARGKQLN